MMKEAEQEKREIEQVCNKKKIKRSEGKEMKMTAEA